MVLWPVQLRCLELVFAWRDRTARLEDESTGYVLPNHMLFQASGSLCSHTHTLTPSHLHTLTSSLFHQISEILPREPQGILACCNPIPTLLRQHLQELHLLVQEARVTPLTSSVCDLQPL